ALISQNQERKYRLNEITVTGTRIPKTSGFTTPAPVTSLTIDELADFAPGNTIAEQLDALPQFFDTQSSQRGGQTLFGRAGASSINIRALGSNRTLILLDGSRIVPTDKRGTINVDLLPSALMRSIDVVTGGASAAYGADAVGGVVNFVLDREFEGLKITTGYGLHETGEGSQWQLEATGGKAFFDDRLHVVGSVQAREIDQIKPDWRRLDNYQFWGHITNPAWLSGDRTVPQRLTRPWVVDTRVSPTGKIYGTGTLLDNFKFNTPGTEITPFVLTEGACSPGRGCINTMAGGPESDVRKEAFNHSVGPSGSEVVARSFYTGFQYDVTDRLTLTFDAMAGRSESTTRGVGSFNFSFVWNGHIAVDNAFLPENVRQIMIDNDLEEFRMAKSGAFDNTKEIGGNQEDINIFTQVQTVLGFDYQLPGLEWNLSGKWQQGESKRNSQGIERIRWDRAFLAMDAVRDPASGAIVCRVQLFNPTEEQLAASVEGQLSSRPIDPFFDNSATSVQAGNFAGEDANVNAVPLKSPIGLDNTIRDCVPYNVMGSGNPSPEAIDYVGTVRIGRGFVEQDFAELLLTGDLYEGWGYGPISFAAGLTWRDQWFLDGAGPESVDALGPAQNVPELGIRGIPAGITGGSPNLHAFSVVPNVGGELDVWEWFGELSVPIWEGSFINNQDQMLGLSFGFRQSDYNRTGSQDSWKVGLDFQVFSDLRLRFTKSQDVREPTFAELFDSQGGGVTVQDPRFDGASFTFTQVSGGNPNLRPEEAKSDVAGFVYQPSFASWIEGLQLSMDWYEVNIDGAVGTLGGQRIVDECELNNVQELCAQIIRNEDGQLTRVLNTFLNVARSKVEGIDMEVAYRMEPNFFNNNFESFNLRFLGGYINERSDAPFQGELFDVSGSRGIPKFTGVITGNYTVGPYVFQLQGRHIDSTTINPRWVEGRDVDDNRVASSTWWNARLGYNAEMSNGSTWRVNFNIQNLFDREPPIIANGANQVLENSYDIYGRRYNLSIDYSF
ncbi:MAG: TonB-dependent receptor, partial [Pseudohongiellaceae bacterium]